MPVKVTRIPNEPILHAVLFGVVVEQDLLDMFEQSLALSEDIVDPVIYRITEAGELETTFTEVMLILRRMSEGKAGSSTDPRFKPILAGTNEDMQFVASASHQEQYGSMDLPWFASFDEALAYVQEVLIATV